MNKNKVQECEQTIKNKRLEATLSDYLLLMLEAKTTHLTTTHTVPGARIKGEYMGMSFDEELLIKKVVERPWEATIAQAIRVMEGAEIE